MRRGGEDGLVHPLLESATAKPRTMSGNAQAPMPGLSMEVASAVERSTEMNWEGSERVMRFFVTRLGEALAIDAC